MILTGKKISEEVKNGKITISPFNERNINPNSYNFELGDIIKTYKSAILDPLTPQEVDTHEIPPEGFLLEPNKIYLGSTQEIIGSDFYAPILRGRSSIGRIGIFINITADLVDIGFVGNFTLQMYAAQRVIIYSRMKIGQVTFWKPDGDIELYNGKYQGSKGPQETQIYKDFK